MGQQGKHNHGKRKLSYSTALAAMQKRIVRKIAGFDRKIKQAYPHSRMLRNPAN